jgi:hypothetical protein
MKKQMTLAVGLIFCLLNIIMVLNDLGCILQDKKHIQDQINNDLIIIL